MTSTRGTPWPQRSAELPATFLCHLGQKVHKLFINKPNKFRTNKEKGNEGGNKSLNVLKQLPSGKMHLKKRIKKAQGIEYLTTSICYCSETCHRDLCPDLRKPRKYRKSEQMRWKFSLSTVHSIYRILGISPRQKAQSLADTESTNDTNARDCSSPCMSQPRLRLNPVATTLDCCESGSTSCCLEHSHT